MTKNIDKQRKVVVGVSGGVDSSVAVYILKQQGFEVLALHMKSPNSETAEADERRAREICNKIGVNLEVVDYEDEMQIVKDYFISEYKNGRTPNPCVLCNKSVKFKPFIEYAEKVGAEFFATGHYARIEHINGQHVLYKAKDENKDQTYFLNQLSQQQLEKVLFPLGELTKEEVREIAKTIGFDTENTKESYDVCFLGSQKFKDYISTIIPEKQGDIVDIATGNTVGKHGGLSKYTLGQRKGLGIGGGFGKTLEPWFVSKKDIMNNILYVAQGNDDLLYSDALVSDKVNWIPSALGEEFECEAKFRYRQQVQKVNVKIQDNKTLVEFKEKQRSITPGQYVVFYDNDRCLGGGCIDTVIKNGKILDI